MFTKIPYWLFLSLISLSQVNAQVIWSEDFSDGIPDDWTIVDESEQNVFWTFCSNPDNPTDINCPDVWSRVPDLQKSFQSSTSENGFAVMNSDFHRINILAGDDFHESILSTSKIDCSEAPTVFIEFQSHIGLFELPAESNVLLQVSTDGINWTNFQLFRYLIPSGTIDPGFLRWSKNPQKSQIDISSVAALQEEVYLRWFWKGGFEIYWALDDIKLTIDNPRPAIDLGLRSRGTYMAIPPNYKIPASQLEPMHFMTDVINLGSQEIIDIDLSCTVTNVQTEQIVYKEHIPITRMEPGDELREQLFPIFNQDLTFGEYIIEYVVGDLESDELPENNSFSSTFFVTENEYHKDNGIQDIPFLSLGPFDFTPGQPLNWSIGNYYYFRNGANYQLDKVTFGLSLPEVFEGILFNAPGNILEVNLYSWRDSNSDGDAQPSEYAKVGTGEFEMTGSDSFVQMELTNTFDFNKPIEFQNNTAYLLMLENTTTELSKSFSVRGSSGLEYIGMEIATSNRNMPRYSTFMSIGSNGTFRTGGFGSDVIPFIRMDIEALATSVLENPNAAKPIDVTPNPIDTKFTFTIPSENIAGTNSYELVDSKGKIILSGDSNVSQVELDVENQSPGIYFIKVVNAKHHFLQKVIIH